MATTTSSCFVSTRRSPGCTVRRMQHRRSNVRYAPPRNASTPSSGASNHATARREPSRNLAIPPQASGSPSRQLARTVREPCEPREPISLPANDRVSERPPVGRSNVARGTFHVHKVHHVHQTSAAGSRQGRRERPASSPGPLSPRGRNGPAKGDNHAVEAHSQGRRRRSRRAERCEGSLDGESGVVGAGGRAASST